MKGLVAWRNGRMLMPASGTIFSCRRFVLLGYSVLLPSSVIESSQIHGLVGPGYSADRTL